MSQNRWRIHLLGRLHIHREQDAQSALAPLSMRRTGALLACLILRAPHPVPREELLGLLWPEEPLATAQNRLRVLLNALRQRLEPPPVPSGSVLAAERSSVHLLTDAFISDYHDFLRALQAAREAPTEQEAISCLENAVALYQGELLPGYYEDWILAERRHLAELRFQALRDVAGRCLHSSLPERALEYALQAVSCEPLDEEAHGDLIRIYAALGQPSAALRQYEQWKRLLWQQVQAQPSETLRTLVSHIETEVGHGLAQSKPRLPAVALPDETVEITLPQYADTRLPQPCGNLPPRLTRFFGREEERARLRYLLSPDTDTRLVSLLGPGGVGKTRLAIETAETLQPDYAGRVYFAPLADIADPAHIGVALARALGLPPCPGLDPLSQTVAVLRQAPCLLILDNLEHLLPQAGPPIMQLLGEVASLHCLLTSRLTAGIEGEQEFTLGPLSVGGESKWLQVEEQESSNSQLLSFPAIALFVDRVQAVRPDFQLTVDNAAEVTQLCRTLEGLPLALELAAARARVMTPGEMRRQTGGLLSWLVDIRGSKNPRHRSLRATLEGSYRLLTNEEQRFFRALAVFTGGFDAQSAGYVGLGTSAAAETLELLERLRTASLLHVVETQAVTTRFAMLETLREFGRERLAESQEELSICSRHLAYFADIFWTQETPPFLWSARETRRVSGEDANLRAALEFGLSADADEKAQQSALKLARRLSGYWEMQGHWSEGRTYLSRAARLPYGEENFPAHISVLRGAGMLSCLLGDYEEASVCVAEGLRKAQAAEYLAGIAGCRNVQGAIAFQSDDYPVAQERFEQALELYQELHDTPQRARCLLNLGNTAFYMGEDSDAQEHFQSALRIYRQIEDTPGIAAALLRLGNVRRQQGALVEARGYLLEALATFQELGHRQGAANSLGALGMLARFQNDSEEAQQRYLAALAIFQEIGSQRGVAVCILNLGEVAQARGEPERANTYFQEAMTLCRHTGDRRNLAACLHSLGNLALEQNQADEAHIHFEAALRIERNIHSRGGIANCLHGLGAVALMQNNLEIAQKRLGEALQIYHDMGVLSGIAATIQTCAQLALQQKQPVRAVRLMGVASTLQTQIGALPSGVDVRGKAIVATMRAALDDTTFAAAWHEGEQLTLQKAIADALQPDSLTS